jgi:hypothetical protein
MTKIKTWLDMEAINKFETICVSCRKPILDANKSQEVAKGFMCDNCYFEEWGNLVEQHPIVSPRNSK